MAVFPPAAFRGIRDTCCYPGAAFFTFKVGILTSGAAFIGYWITYDAWYLIAASYIYISLPVLIVVVFVPWIVVPAALGLWPFLAATFQAAVHPSDKGIWTTWGFWVLTCASEIAAVFVVRWFELKNKGVREKSVPDSEYVGRPPRNAR